MTFCLVLSTILTIVTLVLGAQWCRRQGACRGSGMLGNLPSEGVYEDIGAVPKWEKDEEPSVSWGPVRGEEYDDAWEPEHGPEDEDQDEDQDEDEDEDEGLPLSPAGGGPHGPGPEAQASVKDHGGPRM